MFLLAIEVERWEKYLASVDNTCVIAADVYMDLVHAHTSKQHWKC